MTSTRFDLRDGEEDFAAALADPTRIAAAAGAGRDGHGINALMGAAEVRGGGAAAVVVPSLADLVAWLTEQTWSDFAQSLAAGYQRRGTLTKRQIAAALSMRSKCAARDAARDDAEAYPAATALRNDARDDARYDASVPFCSCEFCNQIWHPAPAVRWIAECRAVLEAAKESEIGG